MSRIQEMFSNNSLKRQMKVAELALTLMDGSFLFL